MRGRRTLTILKRAAALALIALVINAGCAPTTTGSGRALVVEMNTRAKALDSAKAKYDSEDGLEGTTDEILQETGRRLGALRSAHDRWSASVDALLAAAVIPEHDDRRPALRSLQAASENYVEKHEEFFAAVKSCSTLTCMADVADELGPGLFEAERTAREAHARAQESFADA